MNFRRFSYHPLLAATLLAFSFPLAGCDSPQQKEAHYIKRGNELFDKGDYEKARVEYKNAAHLQPTDAEPAYRLGLVDEQQGDLRNAFGLFTVAEQQNGHFYPVVLKIAQYYMAAEQYEPSRKRVDMVLSEDPKNAEAHAISAALLLREKKFDDAESEAQQALSLDPKNISACSALTGIYSAQNKNDQAIAAINAGIAENPDSVALLMLRVLLFEHMDNLPKVAESYQAVFKLKPHEGHFRVELAEMYVKKDKLDDAEATLRTAVAALPDDWEMKRQLVLFLGAHRSVDAAEKEIKGLMQANPDNDQPYFWLADLYASHDETDRAVDLLQQIVSKGQSDEPALNARAMLARIEIKRGDKSLAEKLVNTVLSKNPDNRQALLIRASMEFDSGYYQSAVSDLRTLVRDAPKDGEALQLLGETLLLQGHLDLAIDTMKKLVELDPTNFQARVRLAQVVGMHGDSKEAMDMIETVTKVAPTYEPGWETAARLAIADKQWLPAEAAIHVLDKLDGQHATATFLEGQIQQSNGKYDQAIAAYTDVINTDPIAPLAEHALTELMKCYQATNHMDTAETYLEGLKSDSPFIVTMLGAAYVANGKMDKAAAAFDRAVAGNPTFPQPYIDRAKLYLQDHKPEPAVDVLKKGMQAAPSDLRIAIMTADLLASLGRYQEAIGLYDDILTRNPEFGVAANNMAEIIADYQFNDAAALEKARQAADRFSDSKDPLLLDTLAWVYFRQGNLPQAQTLMERAMSQGAKIPPQLHYHYGAILMKTGKTAQAREELQQAVVNGATYAGADDAKKLLSSH